MSVACAVGTVASMVGQSHEFVVHRRSCNCRSTFCSLGGSGLVSRLELEGAEAISVGQIGCLKK